MLPRARARAHLIASKNERGRKRLELLSELVPGGGAFALLVFSPQLWAVYIDLVVNSDTVRRFVLSSAQGPGDALPRPTETPPASEAPLLAASMIPGPPPVITA